ncbi:MAG: hypothetical protein COU22_01860 [Candidatus Komeilibacteria bacterium CG10_big_fil_rev_8_21_14_0_10_41_13]|uniref:DUF2207 domain-containing protein n=1 Tax=Candidatus Komeilibacteria bacterium CG10_big_fil_rev_8_21_14_0_10_41_13 TaxID=1974476 RepID=A0A2M6WCI2_9BACT|nr:MAG: hypothetical protein COU22_01860 [Candidatus Komeilibacteria bacterium CG10_big_fil_rev_8_21_14_0_10_41_13]
MRFYKKRFLFWLIMAVLLIIFSLVFLWQNNQPPRLLVASAQTQLEAEFIEDFLVEIGVEKNGQLSVVETIVYNFGDLKKHGIFRTIPYSYQARGGRFNLEVELLRVTDENLGYLPYQLSRKGGELEIKIGSEGQTVSGVQTYRIHYLVSRAVNFFKDQDEIYWNVTGNGWPVIIDEAKATVILPGNLDPDSLQLACFTGIYGSQFSDCYYSPQSNQINFSARGRLEPFEGLSLAVGLPKGILDEPAWYQKLWLIFKDNFYILLPLLVLLAMFWLWRKFGRDLGSKRSIIPFYDPPRDLSPAEIGTLIDERADTKDISSTFIDLAVKGYLKIKSLDNKDWQLIKQKDFNNLPDWQQTLLEDIFEQSREVKISDLKGKLYQKLPKLKKHLYSSLVIKNFFATSPAKVRGWFLLLAILVFVSAFLPITDFVLLRVSLILSAVIIFSFSLAMPRKTKLGTQVYQEIKGYKLYLGVAEKDRLNFHNAPEKTPEVFEKNLAYAMVLGVEKKWAKQFDGLYLKQPDWYQGNFASFNSLILVSSLGSFNRSYAAALTNSGAAGGSSGFSSSGGFSGGGFGGGRGGSW